MFQYGTSAQPSDSEVYDTSDCAKKVLNSDDPDLWTGES